MAILPDDRQRFPVSVNFTLLTDGRDNELDTIGIIIERFKNHDGMEIKAILSYLEKRYALSE